MSIEHLLTVGLAAAILVCAAVLRLLVLGALRLSEAVSRKQLQWLPRAAAAPSEARTQRPVAAPLLDALGSAGRGTVYVLAILGTWMRSAGVAFGRGAASLASWLRPRAASAAQKGLSVTGRKIRSATILTVASGQHLGHVTARRLMEASEQRVSRTTAEEEETDARVIVLDREWDPLTDPLDDMPASNAR